jgi:hypothetical protein
MGRLSLMKGNEVVEAGEEGADPALLGLVGRHRKFRTRYESPVRTGHLRARRDARKGNEPVALHEPVEERTVNILGLQNPEVANRNACELRK